MQNHLINKFIRSFIQAYLNVACTDVILQISLINLRRTKPIKIYILHHPYAAVVVVVVVLCATCVSVKQSVIEYYIWLCKPKNWRAI
jgi:hypothetical protein